MTSFMRNAPFGPRGRSAATRQCRVLWTLRSLPSVLACLVAAFPAIAPAMCGGGGTSTLAPPTVTYLRSYRAPFNVPTRLAVDASGNVYVTDPGLGQVIVRAPNGRIISRFDGLGRPLSVAVGKGSIIYVGDAESGSVTGFGSAWQKVLQLGQGAGEFLRPSDLAVDAATGNLYVTDSAAHIVKVYSAAGAFLQNFGGQGSSDGLFNVPVGVTVDATARQVLVVDQLNYRIQVFDVSGAFLSCFGVQGSGAGAFNMPQGVSIDGQGRVYVADSVEGRIQVLDRSGGFIGYIGDFGEAPGQLRIPIGMVIDPSNRLFVAAANNARLEVFGLDSFADPETILPAVAHAEPDPIDRTAGGAAIAGYIEVPGYPLDQIVLGSIVANGVTTATTSTVVGDHDGNGVPDLRVEFDRSALLTTLPAAGTGTVTMSGLLGTKQFEASTAVQITTCGPGTICSLRDADPQCNEAVCVAGAGCAVQPKAGGTGCEDGDACTIDDTCQSGVCIGTSLSCEDGNACTDDTCDPSNGCVHENNTATCDDANACTTADACSDGVCGGAPLTCDDGNVCTDDGCDPTSGCVHTSNTAPCDDGDACTSPDVCAGGVCSGTRLGCDDGNMCTEDMCDPASGCLHTNTTAVCDDADPGTVRDACDGGKCLGQTVTANYALLCWPLESHRHRLATLARQVQIRGDVCAENIRVGPLGRIQGNAVAWTSGEWAIAFGSSTQIAGDVVTGGGSLVGTKQATIGGAVDLSGTATALIECSAARYRATSRRAELIALPPTPGLALGEIQLERGATQRIPRTGQLGAGQSVIDVANLRLSSSSTLTLAGGPATEAVIVHVRGRMMLDRGAQIVVDGLPAERLIIVIDGSVMLASQASVTGSVFAAGSVSLGSASTVTGAVLGAAIDLAPSATVDLHPFVGW
jgi:DNA-binding beta-propeller fold protein YncE